MKRKKKILIYSHDFPPIAGGGATYSYQIAEGLNKLGYGVSVLAPKKHDSFEDKEIDSKSPFKIFRMGYRSSDAKKNIFQGIFFLIKTLLQIKPDLIILIDTEAHLTAALVKKFIPFQYILTVHEAMVITNIIKNKNSFKAKLLQSIYADAIKIVPISHYLKRIVIDLGLTTENNIDIIPIGIKHELLDKAIDNSSLNEKYQSSTFKILLSVARLEKRKGIDKVISTLPQIIQKEPNIQYLIIGAGEEDENLRKLTADLHLTDTVHFLGYVPNKELYKYYDLCDVFIFPSINQDGCGEGFGIVLCEAGARAKPVIAGNCGGISEIITNEESGILVNAEKSHELKDAILRLLDQEGFAQQLANNLRNKVRDSFIWETICQKIATISFKGENDEFYTENKK